MKKGILIAVLLLCTAMSFADRGAGYFYGDVTGDMTGTEFVIRVVDCKNHEWVEDARDFPGSYITDTTFWSALNSYTVYCDLYNGEVLVATMYEEGLNIPVGGGDVEVNFLFPDHQLGRP